MLGIGFQEVLYPSGIVITWLFHCLCDYMQQQLNCLDFMWCCSSELLKMRLISQKSNAYFISVGDRSV